MNLSKVLKTESFSIAFSFLIALGLVTLFKPVCKGKECIDSKAPSNKEIQESVYQIGEKCYKFKSEPRDCPADGIIEPFRATAQKRFV